MIISVYPCYNAGGSACSTGSTHGAEVPLTQTACVVLDEGSVDLRMDKDHELMSVFAGDAHAVILPAELEDLCVALYKTCSDLARTDIYLPPCHK